VLQVSYITLWVFEKVTESGGLDEDTLSKISYCIKVIGLVIMFTVLIGGLFEILRFVDSAAQGHSEGHQIRSQEMQGTLRKVKQN
jgi:hypothetical protein